MRSWLPMTAAGVVALTGGLVALVNPLAASIATITLVGWALLIVAALQGWATYRSETTHARIRAGGITLAAAFLGLSLLWGPFGEGALFTWIVGLLLLASGGAKIYAAHSMTGAQNQPLAYGTGAVSALMGLVVLFGLNLNFGVLLGIELLASGLGLVLFGMHRHSKQD